MRYSIIMWVRTMKVEAMFSGRDEPGGKLRFIRREFVIRFKAELRRDR